MTFNYVYNGRLKKEINGLFIRIQNIIDLLTHLCTMMLVLLLKYEEM